MFEITNINGNYADFVIAKRFIDCSSVTREDFINAVIEDGKSAIKSYNKNAVSRITELSIKRNSEYVAKSRERIISQAISYAERKWKTEKRRNQHVQEVITDLDNKVNNYVPIVQGIGFFDFNGDCETTMGINSLCILNEKDFDNPERIGKCYDILVNTIYFKKAIGWEFTYNGDSDTYRSAFRPQIKLLFDTTITEDVKKSQESLINAVSDFYENTKYCGD